MIAMFYAMSLKFKCIAVLAFLILDCYVLSLSARLNIERGEYGDLFDNPNCNSSTRVKCSCKVFINTECEDSTCKRCRCSSNYTTLLSSNDSKDLCVKDRRLLFIPTASPNQSFSAESIGFVCIKPNSTNYLKKTDCNATDSGQRWIWTRNNQLMHVDSLRCLQEGPYAFKGKPSGYIFRFLVLQECKRTETKQLWRCHGQNNVNFRLRNWLFYMYQDGVSASIFGINGIFDAERIKWQRFSSNESLCSKAFGCHEFVVSAIFVTNMTLGEREISIPHTPGEKLCFVMWDTLQYLDKDDWEQLAFKDEIFTIVKRNTQTYLRLDFANVTNDWTGLIVKLQFYCAASSNLTVNSTDIKCVVIKFKGNAIYPRVITPTISTTSTGNMLHTTGVGKKSQRGPSNVIVVIVLSVVIAILTLCGILGFIFYKQRRRTESKTRSDNAELPRNILAEPVVNFRKSATSSDLDYVIPVSAGNIKSSEESSTLIVLPGHGKRTRDRDIEDKQVLDDSGYAIPSEINTASQNVPSTSTALPDVKDDVIVDRHGYVITDVGNTASLEDESGYTIPDGPQQNDLEERLPAEDKNAQHDIKDGDYEPLRERYDHVYQRLLPTKNP